MKLSEKQGKFAEMVGKLLNFIYMHPGYYVTFGDAYAKTGHIKNSKHYSRLAVDLNLFINGKYKIDTEAHRPFGEYWESLGGKWGGDFSKPDGNHYEL